MRIVTYVVICGVFYVVTSTQATEQRSNLGNITGGTFEKARAIIDKKCTACHSKTKIDVALSSGKDMNTIQKDMERRGVRLSTNEREVLGIFWKQSKSIPK